MDISLRPAEPRDIDRLIRLLEALFAIEADFQFDGDRQRRGLELLLASPTDLLLVAELEGDSVGMASVQTVISTAEGGRVGWVEDLVVAPEHRGRGIGGLLLERLERWAAEEGLTRLQLLADRDNGAALDFYRRQGWGATALVALRRFPGTPRPPEPAQGSTATPRQNAT